MQRISRPLLTRSGIRVTSQEWYRASGEALARLTPAPYEDDADHGYGPVPCDLCGVHMPLGARARLWHRAHGLTPLRVHAGCGIEYVRHKQEDPPCACALCRAARALLRAPLLPWPDAYGREMMTPPDRQETHG